MITDALSVQEFCFSSFLVQFRPITPVFLPLHSGSTFHGAFGQALYRTECKRPENDCRECYLRKDCLYYRYFLRTSNGTRQPVRPYVIESPAGDINGFQPGQRISVVFTFIGESLEYLLRFFAVFEGMGKRGLGRGRRNGWGRCALETILSLDHEPAIPIYPPTNGRPWPPISVPRIWADFFREVDGSVNCISVEFCTPTRIRHKGKLVDRVPFGVLVSRLLKRIVELDREYCGGCLDIPVDLLINLAEREVTLAEDRTEWQDWERYSARQKARMKLGGIVGQVVYKGNLKPFLPYLLMAEYLHVGKQATFGNGVVRINLL